MKYILYLVGFIGSMWLIVELLWVTEIIPNFDVSGELVLGRYNWIGRLLLPWVLAIVGIFGGQRLEKLGEEKLSKDTKEKLDDNLDKF